MMLDSGMTVQAAPHLRAVCLGSNGCETSFDDVQRWAGLTRNGELDAGSASDGDRSMGPMLAVVSSVECECMDEAGSVFSSGDGRAGAVAADEWELV